jgi:hypothetical protein
VADLMRTSNPALNAKAFQGEGVGTGEVGKVAVAERREAILSVRTGNL